MKVDPPDTTKSILSSMDSAVKLLSLCRSQMQPKHYRSSITGEKSREIMPVCFLRALL